MFQQFSQSSSVAAEGKFYRTNERTFLCICKKLYELDDDDVPRLNLRAKEESFVKGNEVNPG